METHTIYDQLAALLEYPGEDYVQRIERAAQVLAEAQPAAAGLLRSFQEQIRGSSTEELQALFTSTFDLDPVCSLEVGWHLFGEQYERGVFLVKMRQQMRRFALAESTELPDHLTHVLAVLGRMEPEEADEFAAACVHPALDKMRAGLGGKNNPFENVLEAIARLLESRHARGAEENRPAAPVLRVLDARGL
ncbi:MAG: nitrate reductase molybdenum cofactor assembly chaperone [Acidobacteria bacterium]|nr:nitrate reductase molybdenum cofactor assembly chaperone [Acidobacteriota bacterium]